MWKSLFVTTGDVLVFIDADLLDWDTHFVPGLLGPAAHRPRVALVKGFYERPLRDGAAASAFEGGRVTELVARPLIALLFPELAGLVQPLAGEWAVRRVAVRARCRCPTGLRRRAGRPRRHRRDARGSTRSPRSTSGVRAHRHQALRDLGAMATQILAAAPLARPDAPRATTVDAAAVRRALDGRRPRRAGPGAPARRAHLAGGVAMTLRLGRHEFADDATLMMAIVNRTPDSFYDKGATWAEDKAFDRVAQVVDEGAEIVDIGGIKAAPGAEIDADEEQRRVVGFVARVRSAYPDLVISVDTWRAEVGRAVCAAGADVLNDAWGGADPALVDVAAEYGAAIVCTHTGGVTPRTRPHRIEYDDVVAAAIADTSAYAERAVAAGVDPRQRA